MATAPPTPADPGTRPVVEHFLAGFHDRAPGCSARAFSGLALVDDIGRRHEDSYAALAGALAAALPGLPPGPLLDLACGDGALLARLCLSVDRSLLGVDLSAGELAAARARLARWGGSGTAGGPDGPAEAAGSAPRPWPAVALQRARAQALPLADGALAAVLSHMALMLMAEPPRVVAELARVLRPGGRLLALLPGGRAAGAPTDAVATAFGAAVSAAPRAAAWDGLRFEGRAWCDPAALPALLGPAFGDLRCTALAGAQRLTPDQAWAWYTGLYDLHLLPAAAWPAVQTDFLERVRPLCAADGRLTLAHRYLLVDATRRP